jgi:hypothetical protein
MMGELVHEALMEGVGDIVHAVVHGFDAAVLASMNCFS